MREELLKGLTDEQIARIRECKNTEEVLAIAKEEGIELTDEQLEAVSGGNCFIPSAYTEKECPICHGHNNQKISSSDGKLIYYYCNDCKKHFN